jgi:hypothetical protein
LIDASHHWNCDGVALRADVPLRGSREFLLVYQPASATSFEEMARTGDGRAFGSAHAVPVAGNGR